MTQFWIRSADGVTVTDVWDKEPPAGQPGWRQAVEVKPAKTKPDTEQHYGQHYFDLTKTPAEIVWPLLDFSPEDVAINAANARDQANAGIKAQIAALDLRRIRPLAEGDTAHLATLNAQILALRARLV